MRLMYLCTRMLVLRTFNIMGNTNWTHRSSSPWADQIHNVTSPARPPHTRDVDIRANVHILALSKGPSALLP